MDDIVSPALLAPSLVIDSDHPAIVAQAQELSRAGDVLAVAQACFEWVRDRVLHSHDFQLEPVTWRASDVLEYRTGYCYAKSHLLAALLRANGIPAGLCYQRLSVGDSGAPYCLHGLAAAYLPTFGWYRVDPRGNRPGILARFSPPIEQLAFALHDPEEVEFDNILPEPLPCVLTVLQSSRTWRDVAAHLPEVPPECFNAWGLRVRRQGRQINANRQAVGNGMYLTYANRIDRTTLT
jgi:transglutaminase-like putative cysteine protease